MNENDKENLALLNSIMQKYCPTEKDCEVIEKKCPKVLMSTSKRPSFLGMFLPDLDLQNFFWTYFGDKGRVVKDPAKCDFTYYYDENDRLLLTKRKYVDSHLGLIFYYYYDNYVDVLWYNPEEKNYPGHSKISLVGRIETINGTISRYVESQVGYALVVTSYDEYVFSKETNTVKQRHYGGVEFEEFSFYDTYNFEMGKVI